ncbi:MAG: LCP family protein [Actinomycetia bacterium]|nr:LCP family protein [Actinomycetes bacterium]
MRNHPLVAAILSALIPGAGQVYARKPLRGFLFFLPSIGVIAATVIFTSRGATEMAGSLLQPSFLTWLLFVNLVIVIWRIAAVTDAYVVTETTIDRSWMSVTLMLLLIAVAVPHIIGWSYGQQAINTLETVFVAAPVEEIPVSFDREIPSNVDTIPDPTIFFDVGDHDGQSTRNYVFRKGIGDPGALEVWADVIAPATPVAPFLPFTERVNPERLTMLVVGGDAGPGRDGLRTDSMNVVTVDLKTGQVAIFGFPRNLKLVPLPSGFRNAFVRYEERVIEKDLTDLDEDGYPDIWVDTDEDGIPEEPPFESCHCFPDMLNKVHRETEDWTKTYPNEVDPGLAALRDILSNMIDLPIDYYVMVDMAGFVRTIDALGGVDVTVKEPYHVMVSSPEEGEPKAKINVEPGPNHLTGLEALAYARWRIGSSDYDRMGRQRCVIKAAVTQADTVTLIKAFPSLLEMMEQYVTTDIPLTFLPDLVSIAGDINYNDIATVGFVPPRYNSGRTPGKYPIPNVSKIRNKVRQVLEEGTAAQSRTGISECDLVED